MEPIQNVPHGAWVELDIGDLKTNRPIQSLTLHGREGGFEHQEDTPFYVRSFQIASKKALPEFLFPLSGTLETDCSGCVVKTTMFWEN